MNKIRNLVLIAVFSAIAYILMLLEFPIAFLIPSFVQFDFSELPALICAFASGPLAGVAVCLIKNLLHLMQSSSAGIGELANFVLGVAFVLPAGLIYKFNRSKKGAVLGMLAGAVIAAIVSFPINLFVTYPFYSNFLPYEQMLIMYQLLFPVKSIAQALLVYNLPFTFLKYTVASLITLLVYKRISPLFRGKK